jgi:Flp pilus assembly pilin Flp
MTELYVSLINRLEELRQAERGQTMAEYGVILAVITVLVVGAVTLLSGNITGAITRVAGVVGGAGN